MPAFVLPEVASHLDQFTGPDADSLVFIGPKNAPMHRSNFTRTWHTERDRFIAAAMSQIIEAELADSDRPSGTQRAREDDDGP